MLSALFGAPLTLRDPATGGAWTLSPLRVRDLAALEEWAMTGPEAIWESLAEAEAEPDEAGRADALRHLYRRVRAYDHGVGAPEIRRALDDPMGRLEVLWLCLRQHHPDLTRDACLETVAQHLSPAQWVLVERFAWGLDPLDEIARTIDELIGATVPPEARGDSPDWPMMVASVAKFSGLSIQAVGDLTLRQWDAYTRLQAREADHENQGDHGPHPYARAWDRMATDERRKRERFHNPEPDGAGDGASAGVRYHPMLERLLRERGIPH